MARTHVNISEQVVDILDKTGNRSAHIDGLVRENSEAWQVALVALAESGWASGEITAACSAFSTHFWQPGDDRGALIAMELEDSVDDEKFVKDYNIDLHRWREKIDMLKRADNIAFGTRSIAQVCWSMMTYEQRQEALKRFGENDPVRMSLALISPEYRETLSPEDQKKLEALGSDDIGRALGTVIREYYRGNGNEELRSAIKKVDEVAALKNPGIK